VLFSEPKIPQPQLTRRHLQPVHAVSVLFSEPKIPQGAAQRRVGRARAFQCSSASRKFLNVCAPRSRSRASRRFSALQRAENSSSFGLRGVAVRTRNCFSALQRAENSSTAQSEPLTRHQRAFQCSSASRKFLNSGISRHIVSQRQSFSALQRAENSSRPGHPEPSSAVGVVSVLFSEPKIPQ